MTTSPVQPEIPTGLPRWMRWGGAGLTALLAVLFVVLLQQVRDQGHRLQALQDRLQTLENAHDLERTNALEEQLRSTVQRLESLEGLDQTVQRLSSEQAGLRQQIRSSAAHTERLPELEPMPGPQLQPQPQPAPAPRP